MSSLDLSVPTLQNKLGVAVLFAKNMRRAFNFFLAVIVVQFGSNFKMLGLDIWEWAYLAGIIFLILSILQYRRFRFYVKEENFILEQGVFRSDKVHIPFKRIQTVNTRQNPVQRLLGVVGLKIDTAGSAGQEVEIPALTKDYAQQLREYLMAQKYRALSEDEDDQEIPLESAEETSKDSSAPLLQIKLTFTDLLKVGLTENHLRSGFFLFIIVNGYLWQYEDFILAPFEGFLKENANHLLTQWVLLLPFALIAFIVVSIIASLVNTILRYYGLSFSLSQSGVQLESGLFSRNNYYIPFQKVQYYKWSSNPLRELIGFKSLVVKQAGSEETVDRKAVRVPGLRAKGLWQLLKTHYPERKKGKASLFKAHYLLFIQYFSYFALLPTLIAALLFWLESFWWPNYLPLLFFLPVAAFFAKKYQESVVMRIFPHHVEIRKGWVFPSRTILPIYKLQNMKYRQSIFQKRRGLASLDLFTAAGSETMPHLSQDQVKEIYDYFLFRIESSKESWM
jgi:putative membrane protein